MSVIISLLLFVSMACSKNKGINENDGINRVDTIINPADTTKKDTGIITPPVNRRYLALGDSYTIGEAVGENERYPVQLKDSLAKYNINVYDLRVTARTGWTTGELLSALDANPPSGNYDLVTLLIGVNNQYRELSVQQYSNEFTSLLNRSVQYAGADKNRVIVISIPDYSVVPFAYGRDTLKIRTQLQAFNKVNKDITTAAGIKYVDVFPSSQEARFNKTLVAKDSLHFSGVEYARWTKMLVPAAKEILK